MSTYAIVLLKADHKDIRRLLKQFQQAGATATVTKGKIVALIIEALTVHTYDACRSWAFTPYSQQHQPKQFREPRYLC